MDIDQTMKNKEYLNHLEINDPHLITVLCQTVDNKIQDLIWIQVA